VSMPRIVRPNGDRCDSGCPQRRTPGQQGLGSCEITGGAVRAEPDGWTIRSAQEFGYSPIPSDICPVLAIREAKIETGGPRCDRCGGPTVATQIPGVRLCAKPDCIKVREDAHCLSPGCLAGVLRKDPGNAPDVRPWAELFARLIRDDETRQGSKVSHVTTDRCSVCARYVTTNAGYACDYPIADAPPQWVRDGIAQLVLELMRHGLMQAERR
jgi:hypothetical protein